MPHVASLIFNCIGFASNIYALKAINSDAFENPLALGFGGQYQVNITSHKNYEWNVLSFLSYTLSST